MLKSLQRFQRLDRREMEEDYVRKKSGLESIRLFFINENEAYTDGRIVVVDPAMHDFYRDQSLLVKTLRDIGLEKTMSLDPYLALSLITRALSCHESMHLLYSEFTDPFIGEKSLNTPLKAMLAHRLDNLFEDAVVEAAGACRSREDGVLFRFLRTLIDYGLEKETGSPLTDFMNLVYDRYLSPKQAVPEGDPLALEIFSETQDLLDQIFHEKSRYGRAEKIVLLIEKMAPLLEGITSLPEKDPRAAIFEHPDSFEGEARRILKLPDILPSSEQDQGEDSRVFQGILDVMEDERERAKEGDETLIVIPVSQIDAPPLHRDIKLIEVHPGDCLNLKPAYENLLKTHQSAIAAYERLFKKLTVPQNTFEERRLFGSRIDSRHLVRTDGRVWMQAVQENARFLPDVLFLIDGSGSMFGERMRMIRESMVLLHEVFSRVGIRHAACIHRAGGEAPEVLIERILDFDMIRRPFALAGIAAGGDNRDGLALYWARDYLNRESTNEHKMLIVLSDGIPLHSYDHYVPPVSTQDTRRIAKHMLQEGILVNAVALEGTGSFRCYPYLREIYPNCLACTNLKELPNQLIELVRAEILKGKLC